MTIATALVAIIVSIFLLAVLTVFVTFVAYETVGWLRELDAKTAAKAADKAAA